MNYSSRNRIFENDIHVDISAVPDSFIEVLVMRMSKLSLNIFKINSLFKQHWTMHPVEAKKGLTRSAGIHAG
jgi:hypothetical protein